MRIGYLSLLVTGGTFGLLIGDCTTRFAALLAAVLMSLPAAIMPCLSGDCSTSEAQAEVAQHDRHCCGGHPAAGTGTNESDEQSPVDVPCDCPPGCPAPCGVGKLPCPPVVLSTPALALEPVGIEIESATEIPTDVALVGVFHPPRI